MWLVADAPPDTGPPLWAVLLVAAIPAVAAIVAAILAARSARQAQAREAEVERLRLLEARVAQRKYEVYEPIIELLRNMMDSQRTVGPAQQVSEAKMVESLSRFGSWVSVLGSDDAVRSFGHFMQGSYNDAPPAVLMRLYGDFMLAARRDMGDPSTTIKSHELFAIKIKNLYGSDEMLSAMTRPFEEVTSAAGWSIPWASAARR